MLFSCHISHIHSLESRFGIVLLYYELNYCSLIEVENVIGPLWVVQWFDINTVSNINATARWSFVGFCILQGKTHGRIGYFPATYVIPLQPDQRVFQVQQPLNLSDGTYSIKFHKEQASTCIVNIDVIAGVNLHWSQWIRH